MLRNADKNIIISAICIILSATLLILITLDILEFIEISPYRLIPMIQLFGVTSGGIIWFLAQHVIGKLNVKPHKSKITKHPSHAGRRR